MKLKKTIINYFILFLLLILFLELFARGFSYFFYGIYKPAKQILNEDNANVFIEDLKNKSKCEYIDVLFPHPYLAYVHWNNPDCPRGNRFNSQGFPGPEYPEKKNDDYFDILITGGSVAAQFGPWGSRDNFFSEKIKKYKDKISRPIRVFNGAAGAYKHPQQEIIVLEYGHIFDLIISIEGFNEHKFLNKRKFREIKKISYPSSNWSISTNNFYLDSAFNSFLVKTVLSYKSLALKNSLIANSHFHAVSYRFFKIILVKFVTNTNKVKYFEDLYKYQKINSDEAIKQNFEKIQKYWISFHNISKSQGADSIIFIQPVPQINKILTEKEKKVSNHQDYTEAYKKMNQLALSLKDNNDFKINSLISIFKNVDETIYRDAVHINSKGNKIMAEKMIEILTSYKIIFKSN